MELMRTHCVETADRLIAELILNKERSIQNAADFIHAGSVIATCSYSSTFIEVIHKAAWQDKQISVFILKSQSGSMNYGERTKFRLEEYGIDCRIVDDDISQESLNGTDIVLLGSDSVLSDGSAVNGYPSLKLASMAAEHISPVPVYIICDSSKICIDLKPHVIEAGFDLIPDNLINGIITENGLINGEESTDYLNRHKKES